jgi:small-conductance mechanosensitive channel
MAGLMLRAVRNFKRGDYIRCGEFLGRVTERGLFHTEIQNERSDLITLPNLHLATNAVTVIRPSGTFVSAALSLGYDNQHDTIEKLLIEAAGNAGLVKPFVRIRQLGDFSVTYEISGQLDDTKKFLGSKSALHRAVLDSLHRAGVEIVSPTFMNQRQIKEGTAVIPKMEVTAPVDPTRDLGPDSLVFDKADQVEKVEDLRLRLTALDGEIADLEAQVKATEGDEAEKIQETIFLRQRIRERLVERIASLEKKVGE